MNKKTELDRSRRELEALRERIRSDATTVADQALGPSGGHATGELTNVPLHLGDMGTDEYLHDMNAALLENEEYLLAEVIAALDRLDEGSYGGCEACGQAIAKDRLQAMPYVRYCVQCAGVNQSGAVNLNVVRPRTPADTLAPEGAMQEDWRPAATPFAEVAGRNTGVSDIHAAGTTGGGTALGGLAGTNAGHGDPNIADLQDEAGSGHFDRIDARDQTLAPRSGRSGGAVGGTPAGKRAK